jgi:hypothetical protein
MTPEPSVTAVAKEVRLFPLESVTLSADCDGGKPLPPVILPTEVMAPDDTAAVPLAPVPKTSAVAAAMTPDPFAVTFATAC